MSAQIWTVGEQNLITFLTNATWEQKVRISGGGLDKTLTGRGEGVIHWQHWIGPGKWTVEAWHRPDDNHDWIPSQLVTGCWEHGIYYVTSNDSGGDHDFNDAVISTCVISNMVLNNIDDFLAGKNT